MQHDFSHSHYFWLDGEFISNDQAKVNLLSHHYGVGVFEGLRTYSNSKGTMIFRLNEHTKRLYRSAHILNMKIPFERDLLNQVQCQLIKKNNLKNAYIRPWVFYGGEFLGLSTHSLSTHVGIAAVEWNGSFYHHDGIRVRISSFVRNHANSIFCKAKANGNYMNSILAMQEAKASNMDDALILDSQGCIAEGTGANFFIVRDGKIYTPDSTTALEGITKDTICILAKELGLPVIEKKISRDEVYIADEAFFTGTAVEVTPIIEVDNRTIGTGKKGAITTCLQQLYASAVHGDVDKYRNWLTYVESSKEAVALA